MGTIFLLVLGIVLDVGTIIATVWIYRLESKKTQDLLMVAQAQGKQPFEQRFREFMDAYVSGTSYYQDTPPSRGIEEESFFHHVHLPFCKETYNTVRKNAFKGKPSLLLILILISTVAAGIYGVLALGLAEWLPLLAVWFAWPVIYSGMTFVLLRQSERELELLSEVDRKLIEYRGGAEPPPYRTSVKELAREMTESAMGRRVTEADFHRFFQPEIPTFDPESDLYLGDRDVDETTVSDTGRE